MRYPERFSNLPDYAFPRLRSLLDAHAPGGEPLPMSIGEPKHAFPDWVSSIIVDHAGEFGRYPVNEGAPALLEAITGWVARRYGVTLQPDEIMALNGTREGLFNAAIALCPETSSGGATPAVLIPNPFYQVYAVAALAVGAEPVYLPAMQETGFLPDYRSVPAEILNRTEIAYVCSPSNPQGVVADKAYWSDLFALAEKHDFRVFADECYSEIYRDAPPPGAIAAAHDLGLDPERLLIFHSLSKRSNLPGLRSGFVAGGTGAISHVRKLRAYAGAPLPMPLQHAATALWADEAHVAESRELYREKYRIADEILGGVEGYLRPKAGFFLWLPVVDGEAATLKLWRETGVRVLPGAYLARDVDGVNPGKTYIRAAMVAPREETQRGLELIRDCLYR